MLPRWRSERLVDCKKRKVQKKPIVWWDSQAVGDLEGSYRDQANRESHLGVEHAKCMNRSYPRKKMLNWNHRAGEENKAKVT